MTRVLTPLTSLSKPPKLSEANIILLGVTRTLDTLKTKTEITDIGEGATKVPVTDWCTRFIVYNGRYRCNYCKNLFDTKDEVMRYKKRKYKDVYGAA